MKNIFSLTLLLGCASLTAQEVNFRVVVYNKMNREPLKGAEVKITEITSGRTFNQSADDSGYTFFKLEKTSRYRLDVTMSPTANATGFLGYSYMLGEKDFNGRKFEAELEKIRHNESGMIPSMYFSYQKTDLSKDNETALSSLLKMLSQFPSLEVEIGVFADCREAKDVNAKRVFAISKYLSDKGETSRVKVKDYGNTRPMNGCDCASKLVVCSEERYAENRRAEFKIISF